MKKEILLSTESINPRTKNLDVSSPREIAQLLNAEDFNAAKAVQKAGPAIAKAIDLAAKTFLNGHKIIFIGAGTSGRLGVLEAVECVPTFGIKPEQICAVMAGGKNAVFRSKEGAEDNAEQGEQDLLHVAGKGDFVFGLSASGTTPYVLGALTAARKAGCLTALITCNRPTDFAGLCIHLPTGAEALTGSTRLKAGSATKMALNAITTGAMARAGKVYQNLMVDVQPTNQKLIRRAIRLIRIVSGADEKTAQKLLTASGRNVKTAIVMQMKNTTRKQAEKILHKHRGFLAEVLHEK